MKLDVSSILLLLFFLYETNETSFVDGIIRSLPAKTNSKISLTVTVLRFFVRCNIKKNLIIFLKCKLQLGKYYINCCICSQSLGVTHVV